MTKQEFLEEAAKFLIEKAYCNPDIIEFEDTFVTLVSVEGDIEGLQLSGGDFPYQEVLEDIKERVILPK
jgi:hypothetical protein